MNFMSHLLRKMHKMLVNGHLIVIELNGHKMSFSVFRQNEENLVWKTHMI